MNELSRMSAVATPSARHFDYLAMRVPNRWATFGLVLAVAGAGLVAESFGKPAAVAAFLGLVGGMALLFPHFTLTANVRNGLLWAFPVWTIFSVGWSIDPGRTWHSSLVLAGSLVGVCAIGAMPHRREVSSALFAVLFAFIVYSLAFGHLIALGASDTAFSGLVSGKNEFGHTAALEIFASCAMLAWTGTAYGRPLVLLGLTGVAAGLAALLASRATGALLATSLSLAVFASIIVFRRLAMPFRVALIVALVGVAAAYLTFGGEIEHEMFAYVLQRFGKDTTLTGRTELWDIADRLISQQAMLGRGYGAFWYYTNPDAMTVWRMMGIQPMTGFNFHNAFRDVLIETGFVGLALFVLGIGRHLLHVAITAFRTGDALSAVRVATVAYFVGRMPVESIAYAPVTLSGLTFIAFLCFPVSGVAPLRRRKAATPLHWRGAVRPIGRAGHVGLRSG